MEGPAGTIREPVFFPGPSDRDGDVSINQRFFTYRADAGTIVGKTLNVTFTIDRPAGVVWPYFKNYNLWQNAYQHHYSGIVGDLEGQGLSLVVGPRPAEFPPPQYRVMRVIPEHVIVLSQPVQSDGKPLAISPDTHVFLLHERDGKTTATCLMEHAFRVETVEEGLDRWRQIADDSQMKWRDIFIPTLKGLVYGSKKE